MNLSEERSTADQIQVVAAQALKAINQQQSFWTFWYHDRQAINREIAELVDLVCKVDPSNFSEDEFAPLTDKLSRVIEALERYFAKHGNANDAAECQVLGSACQRLREARKWIAQGLSPDPAKRMSDAERDQLSDEAANDAFKALFG